MSSIFNAKFGVAAIVAALFVAFGAFGLQGANTAKAGALPPLQVYPEGSNTPYAAGALIPSGTTVRVVANFGDNQAPADVRVILTAGPQVNPNPAPPAPTATGLIIVPYPAAHAPFPATLYSTGIPNANQDITPLVQDDDANVTNGTYTLSAATMNTIGTIQQDDITLELTTKISCADSTGTVRFQQNQATPFADGVAQLNLDLGCKAPTPSGDVTTSVLSIMKVDQLSAPKTAQFAIQVETPVGSGNWVSIATMNTSTTTASSNPCLSSNAACTLNPSVNNPGTFAPTTTAVAPPLPTGQAVRVIEVGQAANCTLVQITDGDGDLVVQPVTLTFPARTNDATLKFINSCAIAGAPNSAGSSIAVVIGGATLGLSNTTHIEINPAPGSDDDARLDIRARDSLNIPLVGAHVTVSIDKGALAMRTDTSGSVAVSGYEVIEPSAPSYGANTAGDTCDQVISQFSSNIYNGSNTNPFIASSRTIQDSFTNTDGIVSACVYVNPDMAPGITPGKITVTAIIEQPGIGLYSPYGSQNLILTATITVVGPPASIKVSASPTSVQCGEKSTIVATVTDSVGQKVSDHTRVELVSNFGATIGGTGATLGFPGVGAVNPLSSSAAETFSGDATAFLLTSTEHVGPYEVVVASGGSVGGVVSTAQPGVTYTTGAFSTAPVSAQVTVTCALPVVAVAPAASAPIAAPRTGEGIRPPNTGDAGLAADNSSSTLFIIGGVMFALAGVATLKFARR